MASIGCLGMTPEREAVGGGAEGTGEKWGVSGWAGTRAQVSLWWSERGIKRDRSSLGVFLTGRKAGENKIKKSTFYFFGLLLSFSEMNQK